MMKIRRRANIGGIDSVEKFGYAAHQRIALRIVRDAFRVGPILLYVLYGLLLQPGLALLVSCRW